MEKINYRYKFAAGVVLGTAIIAQIVRSIVFPELTIAFNIKAFFMSTLVFSAVVGIYFFINSSLDKFFPFEKGLATRIFIQVLIGVGILFLVHAIVFTIAEDRLPVKLDRIFITAVFILDFFAGLAINFMFFTEHFFKQWKVSIQRAERLEREKTQVQYDNLKNQLNPHMLFNAFTSLNSLIHENPEHASKFLKHLSKVYRYLLENEELVTLKKELEFLENYIHLLDMRFGEAIKIKLEISETDEARNIVPVTLQNLLENALKHNVLTKDRPLTIRIFTEGDYIAIENSLQRKSRVEGSNKQGLENLKNLYRYLASHEVKVEETQDKFTVKVPLI